MLKINGRKIGADEPPYIIAELSGNHNGSLERAKLSILSAKECGADAIKMQTYNAQTMTIDCDKDDFLIKEGLWKGYRLFDLYKEAHTPFEWHEELFKYARDIGITIFSTPFDESAVDLLESLNTPAYKIASFELTDLPLISYVAKKNKPLLMSTGMASEKEIFEAIEISRLNGCDQILLFHCISSYPTPVEEANLRKIINLGNKFKVPIGLSDHTIGNTCAISSIAIGACAIEKHFTISRNDKGPDSEFSMEPFELKQLVFETKNAWKALGDPNFERPIVEKGNLVFRRSLYFISDLKEGTVILKQHIRRIRPGFGIAPKFFDIVVGKVLKRNVNRGDAVKWDDFAE